jgi:chorismate synthase
MNSCGKNVRLSIFGESHGPAIGVVIDGLPAGFSPDMELVSREMQRRAPGGKTYATGRLEGDIPNIISGLKSGVTTGAPLACLIENTNYRSGDYDSVLRPGHADWTALLKYGGSADTRGGGHFSGRLTAPLGFAGALAKQLLAEENIKIYGRIKSIGDVSDGICVVDGSFEQNSVVEKLLSEISAKDFSADSAIEEEFLREIETASSVGDSVGGVVEVVTIGDLEGLGEPFFHSVESKLASMIFSVPAVKGVSFGRGFDLASMRGSEANDSLGLRDGVIYSKTNHNGGILGGIANGMPIVVDAAIKPTASIAAEQDSVLISEDGNLSEGKIQVRGRHDPCIVPRAVSVIEACTAIVFLDLLYDRKKY